MFILGWIIGIGAAIGNIVYQVQYRQAHPHVALPAVAVFWQFAALGLIAFMSVATIVRARER